MNQSLRPRVSPPGGSLWYMGNLIKKVLVRKATQLSHLFKSDQKNKIFQKLLSFKFFLD